MYMLQGSKYIYVECLCYICELVYYVEFINVLKIYVECLLCYICELVYYVEFINVLFYCI